MKKLFFVLVSIICCSNLAFAQFSNANSSSGISLLGEANSWNGLRLSYGFHKDDVSFDYYDGSESFSYDLSEMTVSYSHGFSVSPNIPLFLELAPEISFITGSHEVDYDKSTYHQLAVGVPLNFGYQFNLSDKISISPYVGLKAKINILAEDKVKDSYYNETFKIDYFDDGEGGSDGKRFQMGWQVGVGFNFSKLHLGLGYYKDITPFLKYEDSDECSKLKQSSLRLILGVNF